MIKLNLFLTVSSLIIGAIVPLYTWKKYLEYKRKTIKEYEEKKLFLERHNCVITYFVEEGFSGWPPYKDRCKPNIRNPMYSLDPLVHFIESAEKSLHIAIMIINIEQIFNSIEKCLKKGVQVQIIINGEHMISYIIRLRKLQALGAKVVPFILQGKDTTRLMHTKFIIKDFDSETSSGYLCLGSLNVTQSAILENFENLVFLTNWLAVKQFYDFYCRLYEYCHWQNKNTEYNQCFLWQHQLSCD